MATGQAHKVKGKKTKVPKSKKDATTADTDEIFTCPVCEEVIVDASESSKGQDSVYCTGDCSTWLHRHCACLSIQAFKLLEQSDEYYLCPNCKLVSQKSEIDFLKSEVTALKALITDIKASMPIQTPHSATISDPSSTPDPMSYANVLKGSLAKSSEKQPSASNRFDKKYNIVIQGIDECPSGTSKYKRDRQDLDSVVEVVNVLDSSLTKDSVCDCFRLGKYSQENSRSRPLLIKLACTRNVTSILANRSNLSGNEKYNNISVKPDMSKKQRQVENLLLKERYSLITERGVSRKDIKLKGNKLLVNNRVIGSVIESKYVPVSEQSDEFISADTEAPQVNETIDQSSQPLHSIHTPITHSQSHITSQQNSSSPQ